MLAWKNRSNGKTALLIKGARRVGKSTLVEEFARKEYDSYILIDFSLASTEIEELFKNIVFNTNTNYLCINDSGPIVGNTYKESSDIVKEVLNKKFPKICKYEYDSNQ